MSYNLFHLCTKLELILKEGNIPEIPKIAFKIKQIISKSSVSKIDGVEVDFDKLGETFKEKKFIIETLKKYSNWIESLKLIDLESLNDQSKEFQILIGEINLPLIWDYSIDPIFIDETYKYKNEIINYLIQNKQKNIFTYSKGEFFDYQEQRKFSLFEAPQYFNRLPNVIGTNCQFISSENRGKQQEFIDFTVKLISDVRSRRNTILHFNKIWHENQINGFKKRLSGRSHKELKIWFESKNILIISPGPSLKHSINTISKNIDRKFTIIALAQSMPALAKFNITPHFVMVVDPQDYSQVLSDWSDLSKINLIAEESVHKNFINKNFKEIFTVITNKDVMGLSNAFEVDPMDLEGGTVALAACSLAKQLDAKSITMVGQDLALSNSNYFISGALTSKNIVETETGSHIEYIDVSKNISEKKYQDLIPILGWNNENLITSPEYSVYHSQFEVFASYTKNIKLFNCSVGGANIKGFENKLLCDLQNDFSVSDLNLNYHSVSKTLHTTQHREFLAKNKIVAENIIYEIVKIKKILSRKNRSEPKKLKSIDNLERKIITLSKQNPKISDIVSDVIIKLKRAVVYVTTLNENLNLSRRFYEEIYIAVSMYKRSLASGIEIIDELEKNIANK